MYLKKRQQLGELVSGIPFPKRITPAFRFISAMRRRCQSMKDCSVVTATYELGEGMRGTIGIIGPKRMDYDKVIGTLKTLMTRAGYFI